MYSSRDEERDGHRPEASRRVGRSSCRAVTSPEGDTTTWTYGAGGQAVLVSYPFGGTHDPDARRRSPSTNRDKAIWYDAYVYPRCVRKSAQPDRNRRLQARSFTYGPNDRVETITVATGTTTYSYDAAGRMDGLSRIRAAFAPSNKTGTTATRFTRVGVQAPADATEAFNTTYTYDRRRQPRNRHRSVRKNHHVHLRRRKSARDRSPARMASSPTYTYNPTWLDLERSCTTDSGVQPSSPRSTYIRSTRAASRQGSQARTARTSSSPTTPPYASNASSTTIQADVLEEEIAYTYDLDGNRTSQEQRAQASKTYVYASGSPT